MRVENTVFCVKQDIVDIFSTCHLFQNERAVDEGHRRTDLVRYGKFTSKDFPWTFKGGSFQGNVDLGDHMNIFPIPSSELTTNLDLVQNPGYAGR